MKLIGSFVSSVNPCIEHNSIKIDSIPHSMFRRTILILPPTTVCICQGAILIDVFHQTSYAFLTQTHVLLQPGLKHLKYDVKCTTCEHLFA